MSVVVAALYHFANFHDCAEWRDRLLAFGNEHGIKGTMVFAQEGLNGTVAGSRDSIDKFLALIRSDERFRDLEHKESFADTMTFVRLRISVKNEIVTMRVPEAKPSEIVGTYVDPKEWNALISDPDVVVLDTRNDYEVGIGTFRGALNPDMKSFCEFPDYVRRGAEAAAAAATTTCNSDVVNDVINDVTTTPPPASPATAIGANAVLNKNRKVAMFCTGGIRCEKASSFMKREGYEHVYHLKGGILKYLEQIPASESLWDGECYVFDRRVAVGHGLVQGSYSSCFACRALLSRADTASPLHIEGLQCIKCCGSNNTTNSNTSDNANNGNTSVNTAAGGLSEKSRKRSEARQKQIDLCTRRGIAHVGVPFVKVKKQKKQNSNKTNECADNDYSIINKMDSETISTSVATTVATTKEALE